MLRVTRHSGVFRGVFRGVLLLLVCLSSGLVNTAINAQDFKQLSPCKSFDAVKVGATQSLTFLPFYVAADEGFFTRHCIKLDMVSVCNPIPALIAGEISIALSGSIAAVIQPREASRLRPSSWQISEIPDRLSSEGELSPKPYQSGFPANLEVLRGKTIIINACVTGCETYMKMVPGEAGMVEGRG